MLIVTAKMPKRKLTLGVAAAALLCCCAIALNLGQGMIGREVSASALPSPKGVRSNQDRIDYLAAYGWQVSEEPLVTQELLIRKTGEAVHLRGAQLPHRRDGGAGQPAPL